MKFLLKVRQSYQNSFQSETGRSMVEMLGVLAIIGVLSIGGIYGYTYAMNRYRANEILDLAYKYAQMYHTLCNTERAHNGNGKCSYEAGDNSDGVFSFCDTGLVPVTIDDDDPSERVCAIHGADIFLASYKPDGTMDVDISFEDKKICENMVNMLGANVTYNDCSGSLTGVYLNFSLE